MERNEKAYGGHRQRKTKDLPESEQTAETTLDFPHEVRRASTAEGGPPTSSSDKGERSLLF